MAFVQSPVNMFFPWLVPPGRTVPLVGLPKPVAAPRSSIDLTNQMVRASLACWVDPIHAPAHLAGIVLMWGELYNDYMKWNNLMLARSEAVFQPKRVRKSH